MRLPWFALLVNLTLTGWVVLFSKLVPLHYPDRWNRTHRFETPLYRRLGIRRFEKMIRSPTYQLLINRTFTFDGRRRSLDRLGAHLRMAEASHLTAFLLSAALALFALTRGWIDAAFWLCLFNIPLNAYPVMLQRYNRARLARLAARKPKSP